MRYLSNVGATLSCLANALIGGEFGETLSARIGLSILRKGRASRIPYPEALRDHFIDAAIWRVRFRND
jgi:hypothetical protein